MVFREVRGTRADRVWKVDVARIARIASSVVAAVGAGIVITSLWVFWLGFAGMGTSAAAGNWDSYALSSWTVYAATLTASGGLVATVMGFYLRFLLRGSVSVKD